MKYYNFFCKTILALSLCVGATNVMAQATVACSNRLISDVDFTYTGGVAPPRWNIGDANADGFIIDETAFAYVPTDKFSNVRTQANPGYTENTTRQYAVVKNPKDLSSQYADIPTDGMIVINPKQGENDQFAQFQIGGLRPGSEYFIEIKLYNLLDYTPSNSCCWNSMLRVETNGNGNNVHDGNSPNGNSSSTNGDFSWDMGGNMIMEKPRPNAGGTYMILRGKKTLGNATSGFTITFSKGGGSYTDNAFVMGIDYIKVYGCQEEAIVTSTGASDGAKICETSALTLTAQGLGGAGSTYTWTQTIGGVTTTLAGTGKSISVTTPAGKDVVVKYKAVGEWASKEITFTTALCCYDVGDRSEVLKYDFPIKTPAGCSNTIRGALDGSDGVRIDPQYAFICTGSIPDDAGGKTPGYAVIKDTRGDGHFGGWTGHGLDEHTAGYTGVTGTGMLAINASGTPGIFFEYDLPPSAICGDGASYQFSAWYASADPEGPDPCNIIFQLVEINGGVETVVEETSTRDYGYSGDWNNGKVQRWKQTTLVFTTQQGRSYMLRLRNNGHGVSGNDVLIDDILITKCSPKIDFFPDGEQPSLESAEVCSSSAISFDISVPSNAATPNGTFEDLFGNPLPVLYYQLQVSPNYNAATGTGTWQLSGTVQTTPDFDVTPEVNKKWYRVKITKDPATAANTNPPSVTCGVLEFYTRMFSIKLKDALDVKVSPDSIAYCVGDTVKNILGSTTETGANVQWGWKKGNNPANDPFIAGYGLSSDPLKKEFKINSYADSLKGNYYFFVKKDDCENWAKVIISTKSKPTIDTIFDQTICSGSSTKEVKLTPNSAGTAFSWIVDATGVTGAAAGSGDTIKAQTLNLDAGRITQGKAIYKVSATKDGCKSDTTTFTVNVVKLAVGKQGVWQTNAAYGETVTLKVDTSKTALPAGGSFEYLWERQQILPAPPVNWATLPTQTTATLTDIPNNGSGTYVYRVTVFMKKGSTTYCSPLQLLDTVKVSNLMGRDTTLYFCPGEVITYTGKGKTVSGLPLDEWIWWKAGTTPPPSGNTNPTDSTLVTPALTVADSAAVWNYRIFKGGEFIDIKLTLLKNPNYKFTVANNPVLACLNDVVTLTANPVGTATNIEYDWENAGFGVTNTYSLATATDGTGSITVKGKATDFCEATLSVPYTITAPPTAKITYAGVPFCTSLTTPQPITRNGTNAYIGGTYSATPAGLTINATTGAVTPSTSTAKTYTVTYTIAAAGGCAAVTADTAVVITQLPSVDISYATPFCSDATPKTVTFVDNANKKGDWQNGTFSAAPAGLTIDPTTGEITPTTSTPGTYTVTYTMLAAGGCTPAPATTSITITPKPTAKITYAGVPFCTSLTTPQPITRNGTNGGTYSATPAGLTINAATGAVTPSTSTAKTYTVTYTIAAAGGCAAVTADTAMVITQLPSVDIAYSAPSFCSDAAAQTVSFTNDKGMYTGGTFTATPAGLDINAATGTITPLASTTDTYTITYTMNPVGGCTTVPPTTTTVSIQPYIAFSVDKTNIEACKGDVVSITASSSNASGVSYSWKVNGVDKGVSNPFTVPTNIEGFGTIVVSASANDYCSPAAISIPFNISKFEVSEIQSSNDWFCMGKNITLGITIDGTYTNVLWSANGVPDASKDGLLNVTFTPVGETTYRVEVQHNVCPARTKQKIIKEANAQIAITPRDTAICIGDEIILRADTLDSFTGSYIRWEKITSDSTQFIDNNYFIRQRPTETTIFRTTLLKSGCDPSDEITVKINPLPEVTDVLNDVILQEMKKIMQTTFVVAGEQPISYWVDDTTLYAKGYNVFLDLKVGSHILYVTDDNGCKTNLSFDVPEVPLDIPIFFSPNDDGLYDTWLIPELRLYKRIDLRIFDRFGKELEWTTNSEWDGWNGKYMSKKLPSDDYWYVLTIEDTGKKYVGHFTLINKK